MLAQCPRPDAWRFDRFEVSYENRRTKRDSPRRGAGGHDGPDSAAQWRKLGSECLLDDIIAKVRPPALKRSIDRFTPAQTLISFFLLRTTTFRSSQDAKGLTWWPWTWGHASPGHRRWEALSSMANIAGYRTVIEAGNRFARF